MYYLARELEEDKWELVEYEGTWADLADEAMDGFMRLPDLEDEFYKKYNPRKISKAELDELVDEYGDDVLMRTEDDYFEYSSCVGSRKYVLYRDLYKEYIENIDPDTLLTVIGLDY